MEKDEFPELAERLRSLRARIDEFERFHMSNADRLEKAQALKRRHDELNARIEAAIARGSVWQSVGPEFARDFDGLSEAVEEAIAQSGGPSQHST